MRLFTFLLGVYEMNHAHACDVNMSLEPEERDWKLKETASLRLKIRLPSKLIH